MTFCSIPFFSRKSHFPAHVHKPLGDQFVLLRVGNLPQEIILNISVKLLHLVKRCSLVEIPLVLLLHITLYMNIYRLTNLGRNWDRLSETHRDGENNPFKMIISQSYHCLKEKRCFYSTPFYKLWRLSWKKKRLVYIRMFWSLSQSCSSYSRRLVKQQNVTCVQN